MYILRALLPKDLTWSVLKKKKKEKKKKMLAECNLEFQGGTQNL